MQESDDTWKCPECDDLNEIGYGRCLSCGFELSPLSNAAHGSTHATQKEKVAEDQQEPSRFNSKEEYFRWKEERLASTRSSKSLTCPHCEESIPADEIVCPYCAENVTNTVPATAGVTTPEQTPATIKDQEPQKVPTQKKSENTSPYSAELDPIKNKIRRLKALLEEGIITQDEFTSKKQQIINEFLDN